MIEMNSKRKNIKMMVMKIQRMNENREDKWGGDLSELFELYDWVKCSEIIKWMRKVSMEIE